MSELTMEEVRTKFLKEVKQIVKHWAVSEIKEKVYSVEDRCDGVAFSILALLDSNFMVTHCEDVNETDIAGALHELYYKA